jgi:thioesterase domain-containing protein
MIKANPVQIQHKGQGSTAVPLVLIHDGGGTIYSYLNLGQLHRDVYAIFNPHFDDGSPWMGGIPEMAQEYAKMIRAKIGRGPIILGGESIICLI